MAEALTLPSIKRPSCVEIRVQLPSYARGEVSLAAARRIHAHLTQCAGCRAATEGRQLSQRSPSSSLVHSFLLVLETFSIASVILLFLYMGVDTQPLKAAPVSIPVRPGLIAPPNFTFTGKAGAAYYVQLHVSNVAAAEARIQQILWEIPVLKARGPYSSRYYLTATPAQLTAFLRRLAGVGDPSAIQVGRRRWWREDSREAGACSVTLDLLPGESSG